MTDLTDYLDPVSIESPAKGFLSGPAGFSHNISVHTESNPLKSLAKARVAIVGVPDGRNSANPGSMKAPDAIRKELYRLARVPGKLKIADLGNMKQGTTFEDTIAGLADIISALLGEKIVPVVIGGSSAVMPAFDIALSRERVRYGIVSVDSRIDYTSDRRNDPSLCWLNTISGRSGSTFSNYVNVGYQTFLNDPQVINRLQRRNYELVRVGDVRQAIYLTEPLFRDNEVTAIDITSVRQSDAPGTALPSANGFYGEEICLLARYAGISDRIRLFGLFDVNPELDNRNQTAGLAAQVIWFFLEGFAQKQFETPVLGNESSGRFIRYHVRVTGLDDDMIFIKSNMTERWWFEVAGRDGIIHVACSHDDYLKANRNEVPERWIRAVERNK